MNFPWSLWSLFLPLLGPAVPAAQVETPHTFDPAEIQIQMRPDIDVVYHVLAHFPLPEDPSNLYSDAYVQQIRQAKKDLEIGPTRLDQKAAAMGTVYRQLPRLRFLNMAPFMADDFASFKEALQKIDWEDISELPESSHESLEERKARDSRQPLLFGNAKRLIPLYRKRFPDVKEQQFVKEFAECLDEEYARFYRIYREARAELDRQGFEIFQRYWKSEGFQVISPWASRSGVNVFSLYLCPVMKNNGRGVPVKQDQRITFAVVAPLPENPGEATNAVWVVLHETSHRVTDDLVERIAKPAEAEASTIRENAVFFADHLYLKKKFPLLHSAYLKFFLNLPTQAVFSQSGLEEKFLKSYPVPPVVKKALEELVQGF